MSIESRNEWIVHQVERLTGRKPTGKPTIFHDTTNYMYIDRDHLIELEGELFLVRGNEKEGRFGIEEQPKFWVKRALSLSSGTKHILKLTCHEAFKIRIGPFQVRCARSAEKEKRVLELVRGDPRFMQGRGARDSAGNLVRIIQFIEGIDLLNHIYSLRMTHEQYFHDRFPSLLAKALESFRAIQSINDAGFCHGDIRNDHIIIDRAEGRFRWIDFDLTQDFTDFDLWSLGNILHCMVGKGFINFRDVIQERPELADRLKQEDASAFFPQRVMSLAKVYPYVPRELNDVLKRFSMGASAYYERIEQIIDDLAGCAVAMGWPMEA